MKRNEPFSVKDFLEKLAANDPEVALDPKIQAGLQRLSETIRHGGGAQPPLLLIDDDDNDADLFESALKANGVCMEVMRVRDGREALDYFEGNDTFADRTHFPLPLLTILDLKLPEISGIEVLKRMRRLPQCATLAVIILTSSRAPSEMDEISRLNVGALIFKPDTYAALVEVVEKVKISWLDGTGQPPPMA